MTRRWTDRPTADRIPYTPDPNCCMDATDVQGAIDQLLNVGKMIAVKLDGNAVISICDLAEWEGGEIKYFKKVVA